MSKLPVREIKQKRFSLRTERILSLLQTLFPIIAALATAVWAVNGYFDEQVKNRADAHTIETSRLIESRKPFYELQMKSYANIAQALGVLITVKDTNSAEWKVARQRFEALYRAEAQIVTDTTVSLQLRLVNNQIVLFERNASRPFDHLQTSVHCLTMFMRFSLARSWSIDVGKSSIPDAIMPAPTDAAMCAVLSSQ